MKKEKFIVNLNNQPFIREVSKLKEGDSISDKFGEYKVLKVFEGGEYTHKKRINSKVLYQKTFRDGKLLQKEGKNLFIFVPYSLYKNI